MGKESYNKALAELLSKYSKKPEEHRGKSRVTEFMIQKRIDARNKSTIKTTWWKSRKPTQFKQDSADKTTAENSFKKERADEKVHRHRKSS